MSQRLRDGHGILRLRGAVYMESRIDLRVGGYLHKQEQIEQPNLMDRAATSTQNHGPAIVPGMS